MKKIFILMIATAIFAGLSSCQKKFDSKTYAPNKPLPSYGGYNSSSEIETSSLVDYFNFNGSYADSIGALTGTSTGALSFATGLSGKAYQGAVGSYLLFSNPGPLKTLPSYTVSFWMNSDRTNGLARGIFSLNNPTDFWGSFDIYLDNPNNTDPKGDTLLFKVHMTNNSGVPFAGYFLVSKVAGAINQWTHMVVTYNAATSVINIYQNAVSIGISGVAGTTGYVVAPTMPGSDPTKPPVTPWGPIVWPNPTAAVIGTWQFQTNPSLTASATAQSWAESYVGLLDNFRVYNKALSTVEVSALFNLEKTGR
ncbi:LamG-like jellyroll fold domain-containing protein [Mucilaginibacter sp.]